MRRLRGNLQHIRAAVGSDTSMMLVVKAEAYGHGIAPVARVAAEEGVEWFAVAYLDEALEVRSVAPHADILILGVVDPDDAAVLADNSITPIVVSSVHGRALSDAAAEIGKRVNVHIKVDTGMGRLGIMAGDLEDEGAEIAEMQGLNVTGICSHFSKVEPNYPESSDRQTTLFKRAADSMERICGRKLMRHISSSRACFFNSQWDMDAVRIGIVAYGYGTQATFGRFHTKPILQWKTHVMQVRRVPAGFPVSYYGTYETEKDTQIAIIALGYADGYLRTLSNRGFVLIRGKRYPVVGRVTMNWICVDVGPDDEIKADDEVVLLGEQDSSDVWADELALHCRTIPYEIVTGINSNIERRYID